MKNSYIASVGLAMNPNARIGWRTILALLGLVTLTTAVEAQPFIYNRGDLMLGFRKTLNPGLYEAVVDLGPATNYVYLAPGATKPITQYTNNTQLVPDTFANLTNLSWSVSGYTASSHIFTNYPLDTVWLTVPRVGGAQAPAANRASQTTLQQAISPIESIGNGAKLLSPQAAGGRDNTTTFIQEAYASAQGLDYATYIESPTYPSVGDLQDQAPDNVNGALINLENTTPSPFATAVQSDLYQLVPLGKVDPNTGLTNGPGYYLGYFQLNTDGTMIFVRSTTTVQPPVAGFSGTPTAGSAPLRVIFTDASSGNITNWIWNFGNGTIITNTSNVNATNTYTAPGSYTVSLTVAGPGGTNTVTQSAYVVVSPGTSTVPKFNLATLSDGRFIISGTNGTATLQFRVLSSTNLALSLTNWTPVYTNTFSSNGGFAYTNSAPANSSSFFRIVSP